MIFKKTQRTSHNWIHFKRELGDFTILLQTDVYLDGDTVIDLVAESYAKGMDFVETSKVISEVLEADGIKTTAIVVKVKEKGRTWQVILSWDPDYEFEF